MTGPEHPGGSEKVTELPEKILRLHEVLDEGRIPHAFGGALAVDYHGIPRATIDIDIAIFLPPEQQTEVEKAVGEAFEIPEIEKLSKEIDETEQGVTHWGKTRIDLFFSSNLYHEDVAKRVQTVKFDNHEIPIISAEDILIFKTLYDREKDWLDIKNISKISRRRHKELDTAYMSAWLGKIIGADDPRIPKVLGIIEADSMITNTETS